MPKRSEEDIDALLDQLDKEELVNQGVKMMAVTCIKLLMFRHNMSVRDAFRLLLNTPAGIKHLAVVMDEDELIEEIINGKEKQDVNSER